MDIRPELQDFVVEMEFEMRRKDRLGYNHKSRAIHYLEDKLHEERDEVNNCFKDGNIAKLVNEELLHEGIILALLRYQLKKEQKND